MSGLVLACAVASALAAVFSAVSAALALGTARRLRRLLTERPGRVRSQAPGDGGAGDRLMGDLRRFQVERFSVPMRARGGRPDAAAAG